MMRSKPNQFITQYIAFMIIIFFTSPANGEYYFVTPYDPPVIMLDGRNHSMKKVSIKHKSYRSHYVHKVRTHRRADIAIYYINTVAPCCICQEVWIQGRWDCYGGCGVRNETAWNDPNDYYVGTRYERYNKWYPQKVEMTYNPDLTTGDDDTWVNPNMNIDG